MREDMQNKKIFIQCYMLFQKFQKLNKDMYLFMVGRDINTLNKELLTYINNFKINKKNLLFR